MIESQILAVLYVFDSSAIGDAVGEGVDEWDGDTVPEALGRGVVVCVGVGVGVKIGVGEYVGVGEGVKVDTGIITTGATYVVFVDEFCEVVEVVLLIKSIAFGDCTDTGVDEATEADTPPMIATQGLELLPEITFSRYSDDAMVFVVLVGFWTTTPLSTA